MKFKQDTEINQKTFTYIVATTITRGTEVQTLGELHMRGTTN